jgi:hypothetical protein
MPAPLTVVNKTTWRPINSGNLTLPQSNYPNHSMKNESRCKDGTVSHYTYFVTDYFVETQTYTKISFTPSITFVKVTKSPRASDVRFAGI